MMFNSSAKLAFGAMAMMGALAHAPVFAQSVAVTSIVKHPALDSIKDGVQEALAKAGYTEAKGLKWQFQTAQGNTAIAAQIARTFVGDKPDVIVAIAPPSEQAVVAATHTIPEVYSAVTHTVASTRVKYLGPIGTTFPGGLAP